jgi:hypothetical protein
MERHQLCKSHNQRTYIGLKLRVYCPDLGQSHKNHPCHVNMDGATAFAVQQPTMLCNAGAYLLQYAS